MKKAVVLVVVFGVMLVISALALVALNFMTQEARVAEHKVRRIRGFYAAEAAKVDALERLRRNIAPAGIATFPPNAGTSLTYNVHIGAGTAGYPAGGLCVRVTIYARAMAGCPATSPSDYCVDALSSYDSGVCP